ncbi:hypothetical protein AAHE18_14G208000 [Arachis hypogaea]
MTTMHVNQTDGRFLPLYFNARESNGVHGRLELLPRNNASTRLHRRCFLTGRPRANYRDFGLSGHILREMVNASLLPGATRSSW